mmetsp:Transcript_17964/g.54973  ORF Transcript_17964/g.54973 Transcript_17964/m.54973 type:complete len:246 (+) Transcript_17964:132-869(+)
MNHSTTKSAKKTTHRHEEKGTRAATTHPGTRTNQAKRTTTQKEGRRKRRAGGRRPRTTSQDVAPGKSHRRRSHRLMERDQERAESLARWAPTRAAVLACSYSWSERGRSRSWRVMERSLGATRLSLIQRRAPSRMRFPMVSWMGSGTLPMMTLQSTARDVAGVSANCSFNLERSFEKASFKRPVIATPLTRSNVEKEMTWRPSTTTSQDHAGLHRSSHSESSSACHLTNLTEGAWALDAGKLQLT